MLYRNLKHIWCSSAKCYRYRDSWTKGCKHVSVLTLCFQSFYSVEEYYEYNDDKGM